MCYFVKGGHPFFFIDKILGGEAASLARKNKNILDGFWTDWSQTVVLDIREEAEID